MRQTVVKISLLIAVGLAGLVLAFALTGCGSSYGGGGGGKSQTGNTSTTGGGY
jgi:hypothetical protein